MITKIRNILKPLFSNTNNKNLFIEKLKKLKNGRMTKLKNWKVENEKIFNQMKINDFKEKRIVSHVAHLRSDTSNQNISWSYEMG